MSRKAFLKDLWDDAMGTAVRGEEANPVEFGLWPRALMPTGSGLFSTAHKPAVLSRHSSSRKVQTNQRESAEAQLA